MRRMRYAKVDTKATSVAIVATSVAVLLSSFACARTAARWGLRAERIGEAGHPGPPERGGAAAPSRAAAVVSVTTSFQQTCVVSVN